MADDAGERALDLDDGHFCGDWNGLVLGGEKAELISELGFRIFLSKPTLLFDIQCSEFVIKKLPTSYT